MINIFVTRKIPEAGIKMLQNAGYSVDVSSKNGVLTKEELITALKAKEYAAVLCLLTDTVDREVIDAATPSVKIFANYAVGFNNIDVVYAKEKGVIVTNTPGVLTDTVAEHTFGLMLSLVTRTVEADKFMREGRYIGWAPELLLGMDLKGKTLGILGAGRIGSRVAHHARRGFDMDIVYYDVKPALDIEKEYQAKYFPTVEEVLKIADIVSVHVPLLDSTKHLINKERLAMMKKTAYLVNTSRGPVIDEAALVEALSTGVIRGAGLDVFENEPALAPGLAALPNVILTPHIASATEETRAKMAEIAAQNILDFLAGKEPANMLK